MKSYGTNQVSVKRVKPQVLTSCICSDNRVNMKSPINATTKNNSNK